MRILFTLISTACLAQVQSGQLYHGILATGQSLSTGSQGCGVSSGGVCNGTQVTSGTPYANLMLTQGTTVLKGRNVATVAVITQASGGVPASPTISAGGSGYGSTPPTVTVAGDGTGGAYTANLTAGAVSSLTRTSAGSGYTTITIYMTYPPSFPNVLQRDVAPLIALAPWFAENNPAPNNTVTGDSTNTTGLPGEVPSLSALNQLTFLTGGASGTKYILGLHGVSGADYSFIGGPTDVFQPGPEPAFQDGLLQLSTMKAAAIAAGSTFQLDAVIVTHGESDEIERNRIYDQNLNHFQWDYEQQTNALIGRSGLLPMFFNQEQCWGFYRGSGTVPTTAIAQWNTAENNPGRLFLIGPRYPLPSGPVGDFVHTSAAGYRTLGELTGKAMYQVLVLHKAWIPLMPKTVTLAASTITAKFFSPVGNLQFDTTTVAAQPNKGFEFTDGLTAWIDRIVQASGPAPTSPTIFSGGSGYGSTPPTVTSTCGAYTANLTGGVVTSLTRTSAGSGCTFIQIVFTAPTPTVSISSVTITSADTVSIVLSGPPTGPNPSLRYAYTAPSAVGGGLGNLKDTDTATGRTGSDLSDWCVTFDAQIPFTSKLLFLKTVIPSSAISGVQ